MAEQKPEETFKVIDRRPFTAEGELRAGVREQERLEESRVEKNVARAVPESVPKPEPPPADAPKPSPHFQLLLESLAQNALALLGGVPDPRTGQAFLDLEGARQMIDMLDALREKTRGNLSSDEDALLLALSGELKARYLEMTQAATAAVHKQAKGKH